MAAEGAVGGEHGAVFRAGRPVVSGLPGGRRGERTELLWGVASEADGPASAGGDVTDADARIDQARDAVVCGGVSARAYDVLRTGLRGGTSDAVLLRGRAARRVGVIGLGAGTMAAYGRDGDVMRFYEINPLVEGIARELFTYLRESRAQVSVVEGDARVSLARRLRRRSMSWWWMRSRGTRFRCIC